MISGMFIVLEGIDGVGKSSCVDYVGELLREQGIPCELTRETGGTKLGEDLRRLLMEHQSEEITAYAELLLIWAARAQHLEQRLCPALQAGRWVVCDRFTASTYAYQHAGRGISLEHIKALENLVPGYLRPHLTFLLDAPVEVCRQRSAYPQPALGQDRFEKEDAQFFERARRMYLQLAREDAERYCVIDATQSPAKVRGEIKKHLMVLLRRHGTSPDVVWGALPSQA